MGKNPSFREAFQTLGTKISVDPEVLTELEKIVCAMYSKHNYTDVNKLRCDMVNQRFSSGSSHLVSNFDGVDLSLIPPCRSVLKMHIKRVNYQVLLWKKSFMPNPNLPPPEEHGWKQSDEAGLLDFDWCEGSVMPNELIDVASMDGEQNEDTDGDHDQDDIWTEEQEHNTEEIISESFFDEVYESDTSDDESL